MGKWDLGVEVHGDSDGLPDWGESLIVIAIAALLIGGTYFLGFSVFVALLPVLQGVAPDLVGLAWLQNLQGSNGNAVLGIGLYLGALILIIIRAVHGINARLDTQNYYLWKLSERRKAPPNAG